MTPRQLHLLALLASGMTRKEVAAHLGISIHTVNRHMTEAYIRLGVQTATTGSHSMMEAFRVLGWLRPPEGVAR